MEPQHAFHASRQATTYAALSRSEQSINRRTRCTQDRHRHSKSTITNHAVSFSLMPMIKIAEIKPVFYGEHDTLCEPSRDEIARAVAEKKLDVRRYQEDLELLKSEWTQAATFQEYCQMVKEYHTRRIAYFVVNGWSDRILLDQDAQTMIDGLHRLKAAQYLGMQTIKADIKPATSPPA